MKKYPCEKCGTRRRPSRHHDLPKCFFNGRGSITYLCVYCHRELEDIIYRVEKKMSGKKAVRRYNLGEANYRKILCNFLAGPPVEYTYSLVGKEFLCS